MKTRLSLLAGAALVALAASVSAQTVRIANQGDALSMDPHSLNESLQLSFTGNIYEPLVGREPFAVLLADDLMVGENGGPGVMAQMTAAFDPEKDDLRSLFIVSYPVD